MEFHLGLIPPLQHVFPIHILQIKIFPRVQVLEASISIFPLFTCTQLYTLKSSFLFEKKMNGSYKIIVKNLKSNTHVGRHLTESYFTSIHSRTTFRNCKKNGFREGFRSLYCYFIMQDVFHFSVVY